MNTKPRGARFKEVSVDSYRYFIRSDKFNITRASVIADVILLMNQKLKLTVILCLLMLGCSRQSGPPSTSSTYTPSQSLKQRIDFVEKYVAFRREYEELEYAIDFQNNSGFVPAPSDWDVKIIAKVPAATVGEWIKNSQTIPYGKWNWHTTTATNIDTSGINAWYTAGSSITIGVDRANSVIAYRNSSNGNY